MGFNSEQAETPFTALKVELLWALEKLKKKMVK